MKGKKARRLIFVTDIVIRHQLQGAKTWMYYECVLSIVLQLYTVHCDKQLVVPCIYALLSDKTDTLHHGFTIIWNRAPNSTLKLKVYRGAREVNQ